MKYISALLSYLSPVKVLLSVLLSAVLLFSSGCSDSVPAKDTNSMMSSSPGKSSLTKGTVQLKEIEKEMRQAAEQAKISESSLAILSRTIKKN